MCFLKSAIFTLAAPKEGSYTPTPQRRAASRRFENLVGVWLSLVEHRVRDAGVAGSNPATPTIFLKNLKFLSHHLVCIAASNLWDMVSHG